jgi:hypothetical protein
MLPGTASKATAAPLPPPTPPLRMTPGQAARATVPVAETKRPNNRLLGGGLFVLLVILWLAARTFLPGGEVEETAEATLAATEAEVATEVAAVVEETALPVSDGPEATEAATGEAVAAVDTPIPATEAAVLPTEPPPLPTEGAPPATAAPTAVPPTDTAVPVVVQATIAYPNGRRVELLYDANSFYFYNATNERIDMRPIDFEAIDESGNPLRYFFSSSQWTQFFTYVEEGRCDRIEIARASGWLRPPQCRGFNATVTPTAESDFIFWIQQPGAARFRVLWNGAEVARCEFGVERCEVYLP